MEDHFKKLIVDLRADQHASLKAIAKKRDLNMGQIVRSIVNKFLTEEAANERAATQTQPGV